MNSTVTYLGDLRTSATHLASENTFITDAPIKYQGKVEAFSPTDTISSALVSCILTITGIIGRDLEINLTGTIAEVTKVMGIKPRRILEIKIDISFLQSFNSKTRNLLERSAHNCPVSRSLHSNLNQNISFNWPS